MSTPLANINITLYTGIPSRDSRLAILQLYLNPMPHSLSAAEQAQVADVTHGYVGADIRVWGGMRRLELKLNSTNTLISKIVIHINVCPPSSHVGLVHRRV